MIGPAFVCGYAVGRFRERIAPQLGFDAARAAILAELREHVVSVVPSHRGRGLIVRVRGGRYAFRAVVMPPEIPGGLPAVVTILPSGDSRRGRGHIARRRAADRGRRALLRGEIP